MSDQRRENSGYASTNINPTSNCIEEGKGTLNRESRLNNSIVKTITTVTNVLMLK